VNAAIYARYSSELQRATSIQDQVRLCKQAAKHLGYSVADEHVLDDQEISGATMDRPGYRRLLELAREHVVDAIVVEAQDPSVALPSRDAHCASASATLARPRHLRVHEHGSYRSCGRDPRHRRGTQG